MKKVLEKSYWLLLSILLFASCTAHKSIPYLTEAEVLSSEDFAKAAKNYEAKIMPNDILSITVNTLNNSASIDFNLPVVPREANDVVQTTISSTAGGYGSLQNYLVDKDGYINFPVLGKLKIGGLTKSEVEQKIYNEIYPKYIKEKPIVNIRFLNYKVTVLGEVAKPGVYTTENEQMTIFDALASAGDLTIYGKRDNVLLIRTNEKGERSVRRINLQNKDILLDNDIYFLQQNDEIYVQPNKTKGNNSSIGTMETLALSGLSLLISIISIITR